MLDPKFQDKMHLYNVKLHHLQWLVIYELSPDLFEQSV